MSSALSHLIRLATNWAIWALLIGMMWLVDPQAAYAQTTTSYIRTNDGTINADQACNATPLTRTFNVTDSFIVGDVDLGVIVDHTWRGDLRIRLTSPAGTTVRALVADLRYCPRWRHTTPCPTSLSRCPHRRQNARTSLRLLGP